MPDEEGNFTLEDAENDGYIKKEVMGRLQSIAKRESPEIWEHFEASCERQGKTPKILLADMLVRALNNEGFAEGVLETEITLRNAMMNQIRLDDVDFIMQVQERLSPRESEPDPIDKLIEDSLRTATSSPIPRMNRDRNRGSDREVRALKQEIEMLRQELHGRNGQEAKAEKVVVEAPPPRKDPAEHEQEVDGLLEEEEPTEDDTRDDDDGDSSGIDSPDGEEDDESIDLEEIEEEMEQEEQRAQEYMMERDPEYDGWDGETDKEWEDVVIGEEEDEEDEEE